MKNIFGEVSTLELVTLQPELVKFEPTGMNSLKVLVVLVKFEHRQWTSENNAEVSLAELLERENFVWCKRFHLFVEN